MECKAKGCKNQEIKVYGCFCGIKLAYCKEHNYLFREIQIIEKMAKGRYDMIKKDNEHKKILKVNRRTKKWKKYPII